MSPIPSQLLEEAPGDLVQLFEIDMTPIKATAPTIYITPATENLAEVARGGQTYTACPVSAEGYERGGTGALPTPSLTVANVAGLVAPFAEGGQDLIGALVTRIVVLGAWLDGGSAADATAAISTDVYVIAQKQAQSKEMLSFLLRSPLEVRRQVPYRKAVARCSLTYRRWDGVSWTMGTCPYSGANNFDYFDQSTASKSDDFCSRKLSGCRLRFIGSLPFKGFPSLG